MAAANVPKDVKAAMAASGKPITPDLVAGAQMLGRILECRPGLLRAQHSAKLCWRCDCEIIRPSAVSLMNSLLGQGVGPTAV